jgi:hypothetical protein
MTKKIEIIVADIEHAPSCFYIRNALDEYVFIKTKSRKIAQETIDEEYGKGFYKVRTTDLAAKAGKMVTAR